MIYNEKNQNDNNCNDYFICDMIVEDENYCINDEFEQSYEELKDSSYKKFNN